MSVVLQECHVQNTAREYAKLYAAEAEPLEGFGEVPEWVQIYILYTHMLIYTVLCHGSPLVARTKEERGNRGTVLQVFDLVAVHSLSEITGRFCLFLPPYWKNSQGFIGFYPLISESFQFFLFIDLLITSPMPQWRRSWLGSLWNTLSRMARRWISWEETQRLARSVAPFSTGCMRRPTGTCLSLTCKVSCLTMGNFYLAYVLVKGQFGKENQILHS